MTINIRATAEPLLMFALGAALVSGFGSAWARAGEVSAPGPEIHFHDAKKQTSEFIGYYHSIMLDPGEKKIMEEALSPLPAPCCHRSSALTCCCPCNLARSIWGLSHYLIREHGYGTDRLRDAVVKWLAFVNPQGYSGASCYQGKCVLPFGLDGCGGMSAETVVW